MSQEAHEALYAGDQERRIMDTVATPVDQDEIVKGREQFYVPASLESNDVNCSDEREPVGVEEPYVYIHWFGGVLKPVYNLAVIKEVTEPGSVQDTFEQRVRSTVPVLRDVAGISAGVHTDEACEGDAKMDTARVDGDVGCGYALKRQDISGLIVARRTAVIADAMSLQPELFQSSQDMTYANEVVDAHKRLSERESFFTTGRKVVLSAVELGAKPMVVRGEHIGDTGIINTDPDTTIMSDQAFKAGMPVYNQDSGSLNQAYDRIRHIYPYDRRLQQIAELIDTIGTMRALGVTDIAVRRTQ